MTKETETTASISVYDYARICKSVDVEIESEFSGIFCQKRTWGKAEDYIAAISSPSLRVKSVWNVAEYSGYESPGPLQSLIGENKWSSAAAWERIGVVGGKLAVKDTENDPLGVGIFFDETADIKRGKETCGVGYQYAGCAGKVVNCATWVMASLTGSTMRTWAAADLFLPKKDWFTGRGGTGTRRRKSAGVPGKAKFATKPQIALKQLRRIRELGVEISVGGGDEVYGRYGKLLRDHERNGEAYAYFVPRNQRVKIRGRKSMRVDELPELAQARFEARSSGSGVKGPRYYEWAMIEILPENHYLLLRRPLEDERKGLAESARATAAARCGSAADAIETIPEKGKGNVAGDRVKDELITFTLCYIPSASPIAPTLANLALMAGRRWGAEEANETGKGPIGWDENQFRKWESMNHHTALTGIAMLRSNMILQHINSIEKGEVEINNNLSPGKSESIAVNIHHNLSGPTRKYSDDDLMIPIGDSRIPVTVDQEIPADIGFVRLTRNEALRLAEISLSDVTEEEKAFHLRWSKLRRRHQAISRWYHRIARMESGRESGSRPTLPRMVTQRNKRPIRRSDAAPVAA